MLFGWLSVDSIAIKEVRVLGTGSQIVVPEIGQIKCAIRFLNSTFGLVQVRYTIIVSVFENFLFRIYIIILLSFNQIGFQVFQE